MRVRNAVAQFATKRILKHTLGVWLPWALGAIVLLSAPMALSDPGIWMLVFDAELLALLIAVSFAAVRIGAGLYLSRLTAAVSRAMRPRSSKA